MKKDELRQRVKDRLGQLQLGAVEAAVQVPGLERNYINDLVSGKKGSFNQSKLPLVAEALDMTVAELIGPTRLIISDRPGSKVTLVPLIDFVTASQLRTPSSKSTNRRCSAARFRRSGAGRVFCSARSGRPNGPLLARGCNNCDQ